METICILGAGTYGSYLANALTEKFPHARIKLVDVGDNKTKSEEKVGFLSSLKEGVYNGIKNGRFFGLGGTSARWAGQLLFFSEHDCPNDERMHEIKTANIHYKNKVLKRFFKTVPELQDYEITNGLFFKQGMWLKFSQRNFFRYFKITSLKNVEVIKGARVVKLNITNEQILNVTIKTGSKLEELKADKFYLTCGAFESLRLLSMSGLYNLENITQGFRDRISMKCFTILESKARFLDIDFIHKFHNNSLLISRIIGEINGSSFYMKAIFNNDFTLFRQLKNIFSSKNQFSIKELIKGLGQLPHIFAFFIYYLIYQELYVYKNWDIFLDIELDENENKIKLSDETDIFGQPGLDVFYKVPQSTLEKLKIAKNIIKDILIKNRIPFDITDDDNSISKIKDTNHPFNFYNSQNEIKFNKIFNPLSNLFVLHTGILSRIGGINPTASLLCLIEKHVADHSLNSYN